MCMRKTSCSFRRQCAGQATVEAAVLIPSVMLLLGILVQPVCLLYTRAVMHGTAAETSRAVLTARGAEDLTECEQYARRRLAAVPEVSVFHVGGTDDWQIGVAQGDDGRVASVTITGHARPLPLFSTMHESPDSSAPFSSSRPKRSRCKTKRRRSVTPIREPVMENNVISSADRPICPREAIT